MNELDVLRSVSFDWTMHLASVWADSAFDVPELHADMRQAFGYRCDQLRRADVDLSALGWLMIGSGGTGKTHLLSVFRREAMNRGMTFVLVDMTDVHDFGETVLQGYLGSLQQVDRTGVTQHTNVLLRCLEQLPQLGSSARALRELSTANESNLVPQLNRVLTLLRAKFPNETMQHQDVVRALFSLTSEDFAIAGCAQTWLQGVPLDDGDRRKLGLQKASDKATNIVRGLSWLISLGSTTVLAFDQLDPLVTQLNIATHLPDEVTTEEVTARSIIEQITSGLSALRDWTRRTWTVLSCVESTLNVLKSLSLKQNLDRFESPYFLAPVPQGTVTRELIASRLTAIYDMHGFKPPYATWPFSEAAITQLSGSSPREVLKFCHQHQRECLRQGRVFEMQAPSGELSSPQFHPQVVDRLLELDRQFDALRARADIGVIHHEKEDNRFIELLQAGCRCLLKETPLPMGIDSAVDTDFGDPSNPALHARLRIIHVNRGNREQHFCVKALQRTHAGAFQSRLKAAIATSGIDRRLGFRTLVMLRSTPLPTGPVTEKLLETFSSLGGEWQPIAEDDSRTLFALSQMEKECPAEFSEWLESRRPASQLSALGIVVKKLREATEPQEVVEQVDSSPVTKTTPEVTAAAPVLPPTPTVAITDAVLQAFRRTVAPQTSVVTSPIAPPSGPAAESPTSMDRQETPNASSSVAASAPVADVAKQAVAEPLSQRSDAAQVASTPEMTQQFQSSASKTETPLTSTQFRLGRRLIGDALGSHVEMPVERLEKHTVVLAGAGSGKTVLLRRLIEQAALQGVPSIVIDGANDLASLGDYWPTPHAGWDAGDEARSQLLRERSEVVVWTPGRTSGNPLNLEAIPDLSAVADDHDELQATIEMVSDSLRSIVAPGNSEKSRLKLGVLSNALRYLARQGCCTLPRLVGLLSVLPDNAGSGITNEHKLAAEMADRLRAEMAQNPLLADSGQSLDPAVLLGDDGSTSKARISVINLVGLPSLEAQREFLNRLAMTLFAWVKKNPNPSGRKLRGLFVVDEAKDFVPSRGTTCCKSSLLRLTAQARKYHLGVVFATQNPREIDNTLIGNCSTQYYGKAGSPAAIETIREMIRLKGGNGDDVTRLRAGQFYVYNADIGLTSPAKVSVPMSLSWHRDSPLTLDEVLMRANRHRDPL